MPLLENGRLIEDAWVVVDDEAPLPDAPALISVARLQRDAEALIGRNSPLGVALDPATSPDAIAPFLDRLALVQVTMPGSRDGRAFTQTRALREYHGYRGEIRVAGHVLPDHYAKLLRCGASTVVVKEGTDPAVWEASRRVVSIAYQHAQAADQPLSLLRRKIA